MNLKTNWVNLKTINIVWGLYASLLAVLLPHTAWWFSKGQSPTTTWHIVVLPWALALVFEGVILVFTHELAKGAGESGKIDFKSPSFVGLIIAALISIFANYSYSYEFVQSMKVFDHIPQSLYNIATGAMLPVMSPIFAMVIARLESVESGGKIQKELEAANKVTETIRKDNETLINQLKQTEMTLNETEIALKDKEMLLNELQNKLTDLPPIESLQALFGSDPNPKILALNQLFPGVAQKNLAAVVGVSESKVSRALNGVGK